MPRLRLRVERLKESAAVALQEGFGNPKTRFPSSELGWKSATHTKFVVC